MTEKLYDPKCERELIERGLSGVHVFGVDTPYGKLSVVHCRAHSAQTYVFTQIYINDWPTVYLDGRVKPEEPLPFYLDKLIELGGRVVLVELLNEVYTEGRKDGAEMVRRTMRQVLGVPDYARGGDLENP